MTANAAVKSKRGSNMHIDQDVGQLRTTASKLSRRSPIVNININNLIQRSTSTYKAILGTVCYLFILGFTGSHVGIHYHPVVTVLQCQWRVLAASVIVSPQSPTKFHLGATRT